MPLKFCKRRRMEQRIVLERAWDVLPEVIKYVKAAQLKKFPDTKAKSF